MGEHGFGNSAGNGKRLATRTCKGKGRVMGMGMSCTGSRDGVGIATSDKVTLARGGGVKTGSLDASGVFII